MVLTVSLVKPATKYMIDFGDIESGTKKQKSDGSRGGGNLSDGAKEGKFIGDGDQRGMNIAANSG